MRRQLPAPACWKTPPATRLWVASALGDLPAHDLPQMPSSHPAAKAGRGCLVRGKVRPQTKAIFKGKKKQKAAKNTRLGLYGFSSGEEVAAWTQRDEDCWLRLGC